MISDIRFSLCDSFLVKVQSSIFPALCVWRVTFLNRSNRLSVSCTNLVSMWSSLFHGMLKSSSIIGCFVSVMISLFLMMKVQMQLFCLFLFFLL